MKRVSRSVSGTVETNGYLPKTNGNGQPAISDQADLAVLLSGLQTMRDGDFSVRTGYVDRNGRQDCGHL